MLFRSTLCSSRRDVNAAIVAVLPLPGTAATPIRPPSYSRISRCPARGRKPVASVMGVGGARIRDGVEFKRIEPSLVGSLLSRIDPLNDGSIEDEIGHRLQQRAVLFGPCGLQFTPAEVDPLTGAGTQPTHETAEHVVALLKVEAVRPGLADWPTSRQYMRVGQRL